jgi:alpha-D-xyloside xylohydrolase
MKRPLRAFVFCAAGCLAAQIFAAPAAVTSVEKVSDGVTFAMSLGTLKLTVCSDSIVRVRYSPTATVPAGQCFAVTHHFSKTPSFKVADANGKVTVATRKLKITVDKATGDDTLVGDTGTTTITAAPSATALQSSKNPSIQNSNVTKVNSKLSLTLTGCSKHILV